MRERKRERELFVRGEAERDNRGWLIGRKENA